MIVDVLLWTQPFQYQLNHPDSAAISSRAESRIIRVVLYSRICATIEKPPAKIEMT